MSLLTSLYVIAATSVAVFAAGPGAYALVERNYRKVWAQFPEPSAPAAELATYRTLTLCPPLGRAPTTLWYRSRIGMAATSALNEDDPSP